MLQEIINGVDVGAGQVITLGLGLDSCRVGMPDGKCGQLFHAHDFGVALHSTSANRVESVVLPSQGAGPGLPSDAAGGNQG